MSVLFSIIMPVYNNEIYFPEAVRSILEQDFGDLELIIIDDGSTDRTPQIADRMAEADHRVKVIHQKNQWIYASFNNGIKAASGDYIYIVNSDDKLRPGALDLMRRKVQKYHPDVIWTRVLSYICDLEQRIPVYDKSELLQKEEYYPDQKSVRCAWGHFLKSGLAWNQANLYRRELIVPYPFRNDVYGADVLFNISIASHVCSAVVLEEPIYEHYVYNRDDMNVSIGKYYSYEHRMFNDIYIQYRSLFERWGLFSDECQQVIGGKRLVQLTREIRALSFKNCPLTTEEKIKKIFFEYVDRTVYQCALELDRVEEFESRILSGTKELLIQECISKGSEMYFVVELLEALLCYEKDAEDYKKIEYAVNHPLNPAHIGSCFYRKLRKDNVCE